MMGAHTDPLESFDAIKALIAQGYTRTMRIGHKLGLTKAVIQNRLALMERRGLIYSIVEPTAAKGKPVTVWHVGPLPAGVEQSERRRLPRKAHVLADEPKRIFSKTYPIIGRRDPLDVAFFGPAKPHTARCTACGLEQGKGHQSGCIVALVAA